jgi:hypothetical protein
LRMSGSGSVSASYQSWRCSPLLLTSPAPTYPPAHAPAGDISATEDCSVDCSPGGQIRRGQERASSWVVEIVEHPRVIGAAWRRPQSYQRQASAHSRLPHGAPLTSGLLILPRGPP